MTARPQLIAAVAELRGFLEPLRRQGRRIGLVPTMGGLHEGHASLARAARAECNIVAVSIYVNPTQFGPGEDFASYPRTLQADLDLLAECGADVVFAPETTDVFRPGHDTWVVPGAVAEPLEGRCRPGHFRGVATVVLKLLDIVQPRVAYFGLKDYQQLLVVRRMVEDLDLPVEIRSCPIVREPDGLALSSRNRYLSPAARRQAVVLWRALKRAEALVAGGQTGADAVAAAMRETIFSAPGARIDYAALVDPRTLEPVQDIAQPTLAALAVRIEGTRLIDNCLLEPN